MVSPFVYVALMWSSKGQTGRKAKDSNTHQYIPFQDNWCPAYQMGTIGQKSYQI